MVTEHTKVGVCVFMNRDQIMIDLVPKMTWWISVINYIYIMTDSESQYL